MNRLTIRETQVARLASTGMESKRIAERLGISAGRVRDHLTRAFIKTGTRNRTELAVKFSQGDSIQLLRELHAKLTEGGIRHYVKVGIPDELIERCEAAFTIGSG